MSFQGAVSGLELFFNMLVFYPINQYFHVILVIIISMVGVDGIAKLRQCFYGINDRLIEILINLEIFLLIYFFFTFFSNLYQQQLIPVNQMFEYIKLKFKGNLKWTR